MCEVWGRAGNDVGQTVILWGAKYPRYHNSNINWASLDLST